MRPVSDPVTLNAPPPRWPDRLILATARVLIILRHRRMVARFIQRLGTVPNLARPRTYPELMLWRKIFDRNPLFVTFTDKLAAKDYMRSRAPDLPTPKTFWAGDAAFDIPPEILRGHVIVKPNNSCGMNIEVTDGVPGAAFIEARTRRLLKERGGPRRKEEWAYGEIAPKLFVEEKLTLGGRDLPTDIKVHLCSGRVTHVWVEDRHAGKSLILDAAGRELPGRDSDHPREDQAIPYSARLGEVVREAATIAPRIAGDLDYIRVDFLVTEGGLYGGEITVYSASGYGTWSNPDIAGNIERNWDLRRSDFLRRAHRGATRLYADALRAELDRSAAP